MQNSLRAAALSLASALVLVFGPTPAEAQKALVYCPTVDVSGCSIIKTALTSAFPGGVDAGFDGSGGTVDLRTADLFQYSVFIVPSLAETDSTPAPYSQLRDPTTANRLKVALLGRRAFWSGTPDQGLTSSTRPQKDALLRNLAAWASANFGTVNAPGLVVLQDNSDVVTQRYSWVQALTGFSVIADPRLASYSAVSSLTAAGNAVLNVSGSTLAYANMASFGFQVPSGGAGLSMDAVGKTGTTVGGQVVLITQEGANTGGAVVTTDKDDYAPGTQVIITGRGFGANETVTLLLHEEPTIEPDFSFTTTADANGAFTFNGFTPDTLDVDVRFILKATGQTSGRTAQTTFTDGTTVTVAVGAQNPSTVAAGASATYVVSLKRDDANNAFAAVVSATGLTGGAGATPVTVNFPGGASDGGSTRTANLVVSTTTATATQTFNVSVVTNGATVTVPTTLTVASACTAPTVGATPATLSVTAGQNADFSASATGTGSLSYQWYKGTSTGTPLPGKTNAALQLTNTTVTDAGTYTVVVTNGCGSANASATLAVNAAATSVTDVAATSSVFGGTTTLTAKVTPAATAGSVAFYVAGSATAAAGTVTYNASTGVATLTGLTHGLNASTTPYAVKAVFTSTNTNFAGSEATNASALTVGKANATIALSAASLTQGYDGQPKTVAYTTTPATLLPTDVVIAYSQNGSPVAAPTNAGSYDVDATLANTNYQLVDGSSQPLNPQKVSGKLTISPASVSVALSGLTGQTYDGQAKAATVTPTPSSSAITSALQIAYTQGGSPVSAPTNAGSYDVSVTTTSSNYTLTGTTTGTLVIDQAVQAITWSTPADITYGTALSATQLNASTNGGGALTYTPASGTVLNAGSAQVLKVDAAATQNYKAATAQVSINVLKAQATVTLTNLSATYDGSAKAATATTTPAGLTVGLTYDGNATAPTNAGTYAVVATLTDANYQGSATGSLVIAQAQATLSLGTLATTYDGTAKAVAVTTSPTGLSGVAVTYDGAATAPTNAGSYAILAKLTNPNYTASDASGTLVIARAKPSFSNLVAPAVTYGDATGSIAGALKAGTLAAIGTVNVTVSGTGAPLTASATIDASGSFTATINPSVLPANTAGYPIALSTDATPNFEAASDNSLKLVVNKANQSVAVVVSAPSELTYGSPDATLTATGGNGTGAYVFSVGGSSGCNVTGDKLTVVDASSTCAVTASRDGDSNYNPSTASAAASVSLKKATAVVEVTGYSGTYDGDSHGASGTAKGVKGENLNGMLTLGQSFRNFPGGNATWSFSGGNNYESAGGTVTITIAKKAASVTPNAATKVFGEDDPTLTGTLSGFVAGDNVSATYSRTAGQDVAGSPYTISATLTPASALGNYEVTTNTAIFTITPATPTISVSGGTYPYDGLDHPATGSVAGVANASLGAPTFTYSRNNGAFGATLPNGAGTYSVKANFLGGGNYGPALEKTAEIVISPKEVTSAITASDKEYDGTTAVVTPVGCSLTGTLGLDAGKVDCATSNASFDNANAGTRTVTATVTITGAAKDNYTLASSSASVGAKITQAPSVTTVTCAPETVTYTGAALTPCSAVATGAGSLSVSVNPTYTNNVNAGKASANATYDGDVNHTGSTGSATFTIEKAKQAAAVVVTAPSSLTFGGTDATLTATGGNGTGGYTFSAGTSTGCSVTGDKLTVTDASGTCAVTSTRNGDDNYLVSDASTAVTVALKKAVATIKVDGYKGEYDGQPHGATGTASGVGNANLSSLLNLGASFTNVPGGTANWSFAGNNNYESASGTASIEITQAKSVTTVTANNATFDAGQHGASAVVKGIGGLDQPVAVVYAGANTTTYPSGPTAPTNAGDYTATATFAGDVNHSGSSDVKVFTIAKAASATIVTVSDASYDGSQHGGTAAVTGAGGLSAPVSINYTGTVAYTNASYSSTTAPTDAGEYKATATFPGDENHRESTDWKPFKITNAAPVIALVNGPTAPVGFGASVPFTGTFTDPGAPTDKYTIVSKWTTTLTSTPIVVNGSLTSFSGTAGTFTLSPTAGASTLPAGVYTVKVTVTDRFGAVSNEWTMSNYTVVYDPTGGFVTGGGWIVADPGSCLSANAPAGVCTTATGGRANFGFISKYQKGATAPTGNTEFQFQSGNLNFKSTAYQWLVISGAKAQYKGTGTINGGSTQYNFLLTAVEGAMAGGGGVDKFRIKITTSTDQVIFDNQMGADEVSGTGSPLGGGNIQIQAK